MTTDELVPAFQALAAANTLEILVGGIPLTLPGILDNLEPTLASDGRELDMSAHERLALQTLIDEDPMAYARAFLEAAVARAKAISMDRNMRLVQRWVANGLCEGYNASRAGDEWMLEQSATLARSKFDSAAAAIEAGFLLPCRTMTPDQTAEVFIEAFEPQVPSA